MIIIYPESSAKRPHESAAVISNVSYKVKLFGDEGIRSEIYSM